MVLGVTGGIATGKSSVAQMFSDRGVPVVSADVIARQAVAPGSATLDALVAHFGPEILSADGTLDRVELGKTVFADPSAREELNRITHPEIARLAISELDKLGAAGHPLILYEAPLLFEAGAESRVDQILVVITDPDIQLERLVRRDGISSAAALARIEAQMPLAEKVRRADWLVDNSGTMTQTAAQVENIHQELTTLKPT